MALTAVIALSVLSGCSGGDGDGGDDGEPAQPLELTLTQVTDGFERPNYLATARDATGRLFVVEQRGTIRIVDESGRVLSEPFLDLSGVVNDSGEAGLLSVAFHPDYGANGRLFVYFVSDRSGTLKSYVSEFRVSALNTDLADVTTERVLLEVEQPNAFHNGGLVTFGPDGYLWCGLGDGGASGSTAQNRTSLLGSLLRIDVDTGTPYAIPDDNPFAGQASAREEIFAYGFRNPWRYSIDPATGRVFVGDVGENAWEEIDIAVAGGNFGWPDMEGPDCFPPGANCDTSRFEMPIHSYENGPGGTCAVTGGYVYRGDSYPSLRGAYFFADYCAGTIYRLTEEGGAWTAQLELDTDLRISSFGVDAEGEMYVVDIGGGIYRMEFEPAANA